MNIQLKIIALYNDKYKDYYRIVLEHESGQCFESQTIEKLDKIAIQKRY